jgi:hypothetical protein
MSQERMEDRELRVERGNRKSFRMRELFRDVRELSQTMAALRGKPANSGYGMDKNRAWRIKNDDSGERFFKPAKTGHFRPIAAVSGRTVAWSLSKTRLAGAATCCSIPVEGHIFL